MYVWDLERWTVMQRLLDRHHYWKYRKLLSSQLDMTRHFSPTPLLYIPSPPLSVLCSGGGVQLPPKWTGLYSTNPSGQSFITHIGSRILSHLWTLRLFLGGIHKSRWGWWGIKEDEGKDFHDLSFWRLIPPWGRNDLQPVLMCAVVLSVWKDPNVRALQYQGHKYDS